MARGWRPCCAAVLVAALSAAGARAQAPAHLVPFFKAADLHGVPVSLGELVARRRVAVFFWDWRRATSARAMQALDGLQQTYGQRGFEVVAVEGEGASPDVVLERVEKLRAFGNAQRYTIVPDPGGRIARQFQVAATPCIFLLDGAGRVALRLDGFRAQDEEQLEAAVKSLLGIALPAPRIEAASQPESGGAPAPAPAPAAKAAPVDPAAALRERYRYFGNFHFNRKEYAKAEEYLRKYLGVVPDDLEAWLQLGEACAQQRRYDQARDAWEQAQRISPGNAEADANIRRLIRGEY